MTKHPLEERWGVEASTILDAICGSGDFVVRGVRGVLAEHQFKKLIIPTLPTPWISVPLSDPNADVALSDCEGGNYVSIQVKMQTLERGTPKKDKAGRLVVECRKTRQRRQPGVKNSSRRITNYLYGDFDILAVSLWPVTGDWNDFIYAASHRLNPEKRKPQCIAGSQPITFSPVWIKSLPLVLAQVQGRHAIRETEAELALGV